MTRDYLLKKAEQNEKTGSWAENNGYFDAAVSKFYYALYQRIIYISKKEGFYCEPPVTDPHSNTLKIFRENIIGKLEENEKTWIFSLDKLKKCRVNADYKEDIIADKNEYILIFKAYYKNISNVLKKFMPREDGL